MNLEKNALPFFSLVRGGIRIASIVGSFFFIGRLRIEINRVLCALTNYSEITNYIVNVSLLDNECFDCLTRVMRTRKIEYS